LSTSEVYLTATGTGKSYSSNKSDIFNVSKVCEKSVIGRVFTDPTHHENELRKQSIKYQPSQPESNSKLIKSLRNEVESLKAQLLVKDKMVEDIVKKMSSFENDLRKCKSENKKLKNLNSNLQKEFSKMNNKYNALLNNLKKQEMVKKILLLNTVGSPCRSNTFNSSTAESYADHSQSFIGSERHLSITKFDLKEQNRELTNTIDHLRKENYKLFAQNQKLEPGVEAIQYW
jgi:predicted nuclease with TOPRIM domain